MKLELRNRSELYMTDQYKRYVNLEITYPFTMAGSSREYRNGFNILAICSNSMDLDMQGLYIYAGNGVDVLGVDEV